MNEVFFTSDHHFDHQNVIDFCGRPWRDSQGNPDVMAMNLEMVERWNSVVGPHDTVYYVGDFALGKRETVGIYCPMLNGTKHLITGNHDRCWTGRSKGYKAIPEYHDAGFVTIQPYLTYEGYLVNHFPYSVDFRGKDGGDKFSGFRPSRDHWNLPLICGHVHDAWKVKDNQINVGVDVHDFYPVPFDTITATL